MNRRCDHIDPALLTPRSEVDRDFGARRNRTGNADVEQGLHRRAAVRIVGRPVDIDRGDARKRHADAVVEELQIGRQEPAAELKDTDRLARRIRRSGEVVKLRNRRRRERNRGLRRPRFDLLWTRHLEQRPGHLAVIESEDAFHDSGHVAWNLNGALSPAIRLIWRLIHAQFDPERLAHLRGGPFQNNRSPGDAGFDHLQAVGAGKLRDGVQVRLRRAKLRGELLAREIPLLPMADRGGCGRIWEGGRIGTSADTHTDCEYFIGIGRTDAFRIVPRLTFRRFQNVLTFCHLSHFSSPCSCMVNL